MAANNVLLGFPTYSDAQPLVSPALDSGSWASALPLSNLQQRRLAKVARSTDAALTSTRLRCDLKQDRAISLVHVPKHTISIAGKARVLGVPSSLLFDYEAGDDIVAKGGTFARTGIATYVDSSGLVRTAADGVPRDGHFIGGKRTILLEGARTNLCLKSEAFDDATWLKAALTVTADAIAAPNGATTADKLVETAVNAIHADAQDIVIGAGGNKVAFSVFLKAGERSIVHMFLSNAAGSNWSQMNVDLVAGTITGTSNGGTGSVPTFTRIEAVGSWYRCSMVGIGDAAATTIRLTVRIGSDAGYLGDGTSGLYAWGAQAEDNVSFPSSYIPTTTVSVTRNADSLSLPIPAALTPPVALTLDVKLVELGSILTANARIVEISETGDNINSLRLCENGGKYSARAGDAAGADAGVSTAAAAPSYADTVELRVLFSGAGLVTLGQSINGAAEVVAAATGIYFPPQWGSGTAKIQVGNRGGALNGFLALQYLRIAATASVTLATMQTIVYDSGWVSVWPQVYPSGSLPVGHPSYTTGTITAEDAVGYKMGLTVIPSSPFVARYWSLQIDDSGNSVGYIDLSRLLICGGWRPSRNLSVGAKLGWETSSERIQSDGDGAQYRVRPRRRVATIELEDLPDDEWLVDPFEIQRKAGISNQVVFVYDTTDTYHMHRRSFLAVLRELSPITLASFQHGNVPVSAIEEL